MLFLLYHPSQSLLKYRKLARAQLNAGRIHRNLLHSQPLLKEHNRGHHSSGKLLKFWA